MKYIFKAKSKVLVMVLMAAGAVSANAALTSAGDLSFTSFNADEDGWSIVALKDISANTTVFFRDDEWNGAAFSVGEGLRTWNSGVSTILAGTVVRFSSVDKPTASASFGTLTQSGDTGLNATAETIYAYLGSDVNTPTTFLSAVTSAGSFGGLESPIAGTGLTPGLNAAALTSSTDYAQYTGARSGESAFAGYLPLVNNVANWAIFVGGANETAIPNTTAFTVTPVPEASEYMMMLAGLGLVGAVVRKRR